MLDTTSAADWESAIHDAIEALTGLDVCDADDNIYSAVGGNCALNCNLKYGAAAGTCTTLKSGDAAWKDKYGDRAVEAVGWADAQLINAGYTACQYAPEAGAKMYLPTARPTFAAPTRVPTSKPTVLGHRDANASYAPTYKPTHQRTGIPTAEPTPQPSTAVPSVAPTFETWAPSEVPTPVPVPKPTDVPTPKPSFKPTPKPTPLTAKSPAPTPAPTTTPAPAPTPSPSVPPTAFPSLTPTMSQAPTRKGSITWAHVGEDVEVW